MNKDESARQLHVFLMRQAHALSVYTERLLTELLDDTCIDDGHVAATLERLDHVIRGAHATAYALRLIRTYDGDLTLSAMHGVTTDHSDMKEDLI